uniref:Uncharacterized protein n=1 Tax=Apteryx owenii TaxID=8824 RepID=A0A8B9QK42_APTOW
MLRTHSSSLAMSVSSSQGFTSSKIDDLATTADILLDFLDSYWARRSSLSFFSQESINKAPTSLKRYQIDWHLVRQKQIITIVSRKMVIFCFIHHVTSQS